MAGHRTRGIDVDLTLRGGRGVGIVLLAVGVRSGETITVLLRTRDRRIKGEKDI